MARKSGIWFWEQKHVYATTINGHRVTLGKNLREAKEKLKDLEKSKTKTVKLSPDNLRVDVVFDRFLTWAKDHTRVQTWRRYQDFMESFDKYKPGVTIDQLLPAMVTRWMASKGWSETTEHNAIVAIKRALNWHAEQYKTANPLSGMKAPPIASRPDGVSAEEFRTILMRAGDLEFPCLLLFCWHSGARVHEAISLEERHLDLEHSRVVFPKTESKNRRQKRIIYLNSHAMRVLRKALANPNRPVGKHVFVNTTGQPWTAFAINNRFCRLREALGRKVCATQFRHAWVTAKIRAGVQSHVVARLAGHTTTAMIDKVYSHIDRDHDFLLEQAGQ